MAERDRTIAVGLAAGAVAAAGAVGAAVVMARGDRSEQKHHDGKASDTQVPESEYPDEDTTGRGRPTGGPDRESEESGYDLKDAKVSALVKLIAISLTLMIVSVAFVFYMFSRFDHAFQEPNRTLTAEQRAPIMPPLPHLQAVPYREIDATLMEQTRRLTTYGWNSSDHKSAHIPIQRAIQQVVGKPLDGPAQADAAGPKGSSAPQQAAPALNADIQQEKPANRVQGEGNPNAVAPTMKTPPAPGANP